MVRAARRGGDPAIVSQLHARPARFDRRRSPQVEGGPGWGAGARVRMAESFLAQDLVKAEVQAGGDYLRPRR